MSQNPYDPYAQNPQEPSGQGQPNQQGGYYQQPGAGYNQGYQGQQPGYQQGPPMAADGGLSALTLNLWLSVFFGWIPALIFFLTSRDNSIPAVREAHTKNMNFALIRLIVGMVTAIPVLGWIVGGIGSLVLFVFAIINAVQVPEQIRTNQAPQFMMDNVTAPTWIK
ncbi:MAG: DUF4870 domain-containing protein [Galactobacter sp.]